MPRATVPRELAHALVAVALGAAVLAGAIDLTARVAAAPVPDLDLSADDLPPLEEVIDTRASVASTVVAADGSVLARFRPEHTYVPIAAGHVPANVRAAVLGAEDAAFAHHGGFDAAAIARAAVRNVAAGESVQGGSTITQQLAKNLFTSDARTLERKVHELKIAIELEDRYTKDELLAAYLNSSYFGQGAVGVIAAAETYFGKAVDEVTLSEAALLASALPAPSDRNPVIAPKHAERERLRILDAVEDAGLAPAEQVARARAERPKLLDARRARLHDVRHPYFVDYVRRFLLDEIGVSESRLFGGGLRIETTLHPRIQARATDAVRARLGAPGDPAGAVAVVEPGTGHVKALVGGRDWSRSKVNLALGAEGGGTGRQPGSSFKPFVLATALAKGWHPQQPVPAPEQYQPVGADAPVHNATGRGYGVLTLEEATVRSVNTSYTWITERLGPRAVAAMARRLGLEVPRNVGPSIGIGTYETSPLDMAAAYAAFAADGTYAPPTPVLRIRDRSGEVVARAPFDAPRKVLTPKVARHVTRILEQVIARGTGRRADFGRPTAGKTGTTNDYRDAWFVGYTPDLVAAVWMGYTDRPRPMRGIGGFDRIEGGTVPALLWHDVMAAAHAHIAPHDFPPPPKLAPLQPSSTEPARRGGTKEGKGDDGDGGRGGGGGGGGDDKKGKR